MSEKTRSAPLADDERPRQGLGTQGLANQRRSDVMLVRWPSQISALPVGDRGPVIALLEATTPPPHYDPLAMSLFAGYVAPRPVYKVAKRSFDIVVASALLVLLSPLLVVTFVIVRATSPGPAIFRQRRCGQDGAPFTCFKFRTMGCDAEEARETLLPHNESSGPVFKMRHDPRVTPVGRLLRKASIDELPQLCNVVRGEMSLVGPRPPLPEEVDVYTHRERLRLSVRPGMTGLWQVSGRSKLSFERWIELDLEYVRKRSFTLDLWVLLRTVPAVISGRGAW